MKRTTLLAALLFPVLIACTDDETIGTQQGHEIEFRQSVETTRGSVMYVSDLGSFSVSAFFQDRSKGHGSTSYYFRNKTFTRQTTQVNNAWQYRSATPSYWPGDNSMLDFVATYPAGLFTTYDKKFDYTMPEYEPSQQDVMLAYGSGCKSANELTGVPMKFHHILSRVDLKMKNANSAYTIKVKGYMFCQLYTTGRVVITTSESSSNASDFTSAFKTSGTVTWANLGTRGRVSYLRDVTLGSSFTFLTNQYVMAIPQTNTAATQADLAASTPPAGKTYIAVLAQIRTKDGAYVYPYSASSTSTVPYNGSTVSGYGWLAVGVSTSWQQGKAIIYNLDITNGGGIVPSFPGPPSDGHWAAGDKVNGAEITYSVTMDSWPSDEYRDWDKYNGTHN